MADIYAEVIVDIQKSALDRAFTYLVPEELREDACVGARVRVPFGNRMITGYIVGFQDTSGYDPDKIKAVDAVLTDQETAESKLVQLAAWIARYYSCNFSQALRTVLPARRKMAAKEESTIWLAKSVEETDALRKTFEEKHAVAKARVLNCLLAENGQKRPLLMKQAGVPGQVIKGLVESGILTEETVNTLRGLIPSGHIEKEIPPTLGKEQMAALDAIRGEWESGRPVLLHGATGSGKTLIYMELIEEVLREGKQAIVLIPEIALTYQTVKRFTGRFGDQVSFLHSRLSDGEKYDLHKAARNGAVKIMIGPRSALFTPFPDLGMIIVDEEHEDTYRSESTPRYDAIETAEMRCRIEGAKLLLGTATPSIKTYEKTRRGEIGLVKLPYRYGTSERKIVLVDMKEELMKGNRSVLSGPMRAELSKVLEEGHQAMLFLNRRGYAGFVTCRSCGYVVKCPHCDISLTEHTNGTLVCHYCGHTQPMLRNCPSCGSPAIGGMRIGTEQVERQIAEVFPSARIVRMDRDTTGGKEGHTKILRQFAAKEADILIGTQMIVKGHDFPKVALIGVLAADLSLNDADYRSSERTFSLIAQAIGRCGRADVNGCAVIQTFQPEHYSIQAAVNDAYEDFYDQEIAYRTLLDYPPRAEMMAVLGSSEEEETLEKAMKHIRMLIDRIDPKGTAHALGPAPLSVKKVRDRYREAIYLRHPAHEVLTEIAARITQYITVNRGFDPVIIQFDYNA